MTTQMTLLSAPIELTGDWGASSPEDALVVLSRMRDVCLTGLSLLADDQPATLRVESRASGPPHVWLQSSTRALGLRSFDNNIILPYTLGGAKQ
jgi:hypothetical protein